MIKYYGIVGLCLERSINYHRMQKYWLLLLLQVLLILIIVIIIVIIILI